MRHTGESTGVAARPRASVLALLFLLVTVAAPTVDAWLHAGDGAAAAAQHLGAGDCVVCRLAATPSVLSPGSEATVAEATTVELRHFARVEARVCAAPGRSRPPTRAPPA